MCPWNYTSIIVIQVGHIERFNPVIQKLNQLLENPKFISFDARRLCMTDRNHDVDVVLDLMIHDIDILLSLEKTDLYSITAVGTYSDSHRLHLDNERPRLINI